MPLDAIDKTPPDELTYLALEDLLKSLGSKDISRRDLNLRIKYRQDPYTKALITQYGLKWVASGARRLLLADVFKHKVIAEDKFSKTIYFTDLESESEEGQASGSAGGKAARNRPQPGWPGTLQGEFASDPQNYSQNQWKSEPLLQTLAGVRHKKECKGQPIPIDDNEDPLSPHPVVLPMRTQHALLSNLVQLLEVSCYDYATIYAPHLMKYDGPEECELTKWTASFSESKTFLSQDENLNAQRESLLREVARMRHNVVHRERVGVDTMAQNFRSAEELTILMGDVKAQGIISKMWQAIRKEARVLMQDTMARFEEHTKSMEPIRLRKDALDAQEKKQLTSSQRDALASKREAVLAVEDALIKQAQQDYHELSLATGRAMEQAISERGIILGTLGVRISPPNVPTNAAGPHEDEVVNIRADASELLSLRTEDAENDVGGSHKEVEGAQEDEGSNVQPSEGTAGVKGKHKKEEPHEKKVQMPEQKQDVEEGGIPLRRQGESPWGRQGGSPWGTQGASSAGRQVEPSTRRQGESPWGGQGESPGRRQEESPWGRQGESSARGKVTLMPRAEWRPMLEEIDAGYQAGREGAPPKRYASLYRKKAQVVPEEEQKLDSANGSQNGTGPHTKKNEKGPRTKKKWSPLEI